MKGGVKVSLTVAPGVVTIRGGELRLELLRPNQRRVIRTHTPSIIGIDDSNNARSTNTQVEQAPLRQRKAISQKQLKGMLELNMARFSCCSRCVVKTEEERFILPNGRPEIGPHAKSEEEAEWNQVWGYPDVRRPGGGVAFHGEVAQ